MQAPLRRCLPLTAAVAMLGVFVPLAQAQTYATQPVSVAFSAPVDLLAQVRARLVDGGIEVIAKDPSGKNLAVGKLSIIDNQIDRVSGTIRLKATFDNAKADLSSGQFVNVQVLGYETTGEVLP